MLAGLAEEPLDGHRKPPKRTQNVLPEPCPELENDVHARLLDGRAVHHYVQFVEPRIRQVHVEVDRPGLPRPPSDAFSPAHAVRLPTTVSTTCMLESGSAVLVGERTGPKADEVMPASSDVLRSVEEAFAALESCGLAFFVELSVGAVLIDPDREGATLAASHPFEVAVAPGTSVVPQLLRGAAEQFAWQWIEAECDAGAPLAAEPRTSQELVRVVGLFGSCVALEYARRTKATGDDWAIASHDAVRAVTESIVDDLAALPVRLTAELITCWFPFWRRSSLIFGASSFDHISDLAAFYTGR